MKTQDKSKKRKILKWVLMIILLIFFGVIVSFFAMEFHGRHQMLEKRDELIEVSAPEIEEEVIIEEEGVVITYGGERYQYNENVTAVLCMGIDKEALESDEVLIGNSGQADTLLLAILDVESGDVKLWNISREAMTDVDIYNVEGEYVSTEKLQACLAYAYGDGKQTSCENTVRAVSRLLYGMPIQSYAAVDLDVIRPLNDAVGGVEVTIQEGDILPWQMEAGTTIHLTGERVERFVRYRSPGAEGGSLDSNNNRMSRQKRYMMSFIQKALQQTKEDISTPLKLFKIAMEDDHMITNLDISKITYLTTIFSKVNFTEDSFWTVPGEIRAGEEYAEFHVDDEVLYEKILETFYKKIDK